MLNITKEKILELNVSVPLNEESIHKIIQQLVPVEKIDEILYFVNLNMRVD
jgi:hypothetical protein